MTVINKLTDAQLADEWHLWNEKVVNATSWGAGLAAAAEFRTECEREIYKRNIVVTGYNDETYFFAKISGDHAFINWMVERLVNVYNESPHTDFVSTLKEFAKAGERIRDKENELKKIRETLSKL